MVLAILKIKIPLSFSYWNGSQSLKCKLSGISTGIELSHKPINQYYSKQQVLGLLYHELCEDRLRDLLNLNNFEKIQSRLTQFSLKHNSKFNFALYPELSSWPEVKNIYNYFYSSTYKNNGDATLIIERQLFSKDRKLNGRPDLIIDTSPDLNVVEYKSGTIYELDGTLKSSYTDQLHFYSILVKETWGYLPRKNILRSLINGDVEIASDEARGNWLASNIKSKITEITNILSSELTIGEQLDTLSEVDISTCKYCDLRIVCTKFQKIQPTLLNHIAIYGIVNSFVVSGKHYYAQALIETDSGIIKILNIPRVQETVIRVGVKIGIINLKRNSNLDLEFENNSKVVIYE